MPRHTGMAPLSVSDRAHRFTSFGSCNAQSEYSSVSVKASPWADEFFSPDSIVERRFTVVLVCLDRSANGFLHGFGHQFNAHRGHFDERVDLFGDK
jgi:hypothetical protein